MTYRINSGTKNVMIIGAGAAGRIIIREMMTSSHLNEQIRCIIDDDESKVGRFINGIPIVGGRDRIQDAVLNIR
jgi:FlaA1/EpsC-like NDP-sugar epimerase